MDLLSYGTSRRLHVSRLGGEIRTLWVQEPGDSVGYRHQLMQQTQSLCLQLHGNHIDARGVATRPVEAGDETFLYGLVAGREYNRNRVCGCLGGLATHESPRGGPP